MGRAQRAGVGEDALVQSQDVRRCVWAGHCHLWAEGRPWQGDIQVPRAPPNPRQRFPTAGLAEALPANGGAVP